MNKRARFDTLYDRISEKYTADDAYSASALKILNSYVGLQDQKNALISKYVPEELKIALIEAIDRSSFEDIQNLTLLCIDIERFSSEQLVWQGIAAVAVENVLVPAKVSRFLRDINDDLRYRLSQITDKDIAMFISKSRYERSKRTRRRDSSTISKIFDFVNGEREPDFTKSIICHSFENFGRYTVLSFVDYFARNFKELLTRSLTSNDDRDDDNRLISEFIAKRFNNKRWKTKLETLNERTTVFAESPCPSPTSSNASLRTVITNIDDVKNEISPITGNDESAEKRNNESKDRDYSKDGENDFVFNEHGGEAQLHRLVKVNDSIRCGSGSEEPQQNYFYRQILIKEEDGYDDETNDVWSDDDENDDDRSEGSPDREVPTENESDVCGENDIWKKNDYISQSSFDLKLSTTGDYGAYKNDVEIWEIDQESQNIFDRTVPTNGENGVYENHIPNVETDYKPQSNVDRTVLVNAGCFAYENERRSQSNFDRETIIRGESDDYENDIWHINDNDDDYETRQNRFEGEIPTIDDESDCE